MNLSSLEDAQRISTRDFLCDSATTHCESVTMQHENYEAHQRSWSGQNAERCQNPPGPVDRADLHHRIKRAFAETGFTMAQTWKWSGAHTSI